MSSRPSPIPSDVFERPSSPSPSIRSQSSQTSARIPSSFSPFRPVILPSTFSTRPNVYRPGAVPPPPNLMIGQSMPFGEIGKEVEDNWETASVSSFGGGGEEASQGRAFHPRLRDLRQPRPNVRKPETKELEAKEEKQEEVPGELVIKEAESEKAEELVEDKRMEGERNGEAAEDGNTKLAESTPEKSATEPTNERAEQETVRDKEEDKSSPAETPDSETR